jgi:hypothetical protein
LFVPLSFIRDGQRFSLPGVRHEMEEMATRILSLTMAVAVGLLGLTGTAAADPDKDESGKGRRRGGYERFERDYDRPRQIYWRRAFKQEYDDGYCKYERKLEKSGEYKEEVKCRGGVRPTFGSRY